ncbi:VOC family protein [Telmatospirillum siberiense]|uniref:Glyoxalase n=1 Tax=Telmatospirillum siberiense TaxID=382514 RepID=A0A2N3PQQ1_9PROT|nr:VOC family protein [Telmatospirillum siberiense]PKU22731.1 glyoxalase [Telmatospirillum siberiense]
MTALLAANAAERVGDHVPAPSFVPRKVSLVVHDLARVGDFYQRAVGLHRLQDDGETALFGADGGAVLLELRRDAAARRRGMREAGLFHTAFLLPSRADLVGWASHAAAVRSPIIGAADHGVSEAFYLADPEGNGVEITADRPKSRWKRKDGMVEMVTDPLDVDDLLAAAPGGRWRGFPDGSRIGHIHLQVGAIGPAEDFYAGALGLQVTCHYPGATFFAADGYHHHIAANIWNSRGAERRDGPVIGLADIEIGVDGGRMAAAGDRAATRLTMTDPWGIGISLAVL